MTMMVKREPSHSGNVDSNLLVLFSLSLFDDSLSSVTLSFNFLLSSFSFVIPNSSSPSIIER